LLLHCFIVRNDCIISKSSERMNTVDFSFIQENAKGYPVG